LIDFTERPAGNIEEKVVQEPTLEIDQLERESYPGDFPVFSIDFPEEVPEGSIRAFLNTLTESYEYTVVILPEGYGNILRRVYERSDRMLFLTKDTEEAFLSTEMFMDQLQKDLNLSAIPVEVVLNQSDEAGPRQRQAAEERLGVPVKAQLPTIQDKNYVDNFESGPPYVLEQPSKPYSRNIRRIAHRVCGMSLGIALGSGAARGLAHIGVLEVLEEENIQADMVAGSSMGALVGAGYALGHSPKRMRRFAREFDEMGGFFRLTDLSLPPSQSILRLSRIRNFLEDLYGDATFEDTEIPLVITASSINSAQRRAITEGRLVDAILASIAIPMIYPPQTSNGSTWVDGGVFEPVPVESLQEEGMNRVVAVNTIPPQGVLGEQQPERLGPGPEKRQIPSLIKKFVPIGSGNIIDVGMRTIEAIEARLAEDSTKQADVVVDPYLPEMSWFDFDQYEKFIEQGRRSAREKIDKIRSLSPRSTDRPANPDYQS
jgi:NTE family protein